MAIALAIVMSACAGSEVGSAPTAGSLDATATASAGALPVDGPIVDEAIKLAQRLADRLGADDVATEALLIGAELGYSGPQLLGGVEAGTLQADGTISGVTAAERPLGRIDLGARSAQASASTKPVKQPTRHVARFQDSVENDKIVLEELREAAASSGAFRFEEQQVLGLEGVNLILLMLLMGLSPEQVIEGLVLGVYFYEQDGVCYTQALTVGAKEPQVRPCSSDQQVDAPAPDADVDDPPALTVDEPVVGAQYAGSLAGVLVDDPASTISVIISPEGVVSGQLTATEQLDNYIASISLCGIMGEDRDECGDQVDDCPATVLWSSDLSTLQFRGSPPDRGTVSGTITIVWDTTPDGCGEPSTESTVFEIEANISPEGAQITVPLEINLERLPPNS